MARPVKVSWETSLFDVVFDDDNDELHENTIEVSVCPRPGYCDEHIVEVEVHSIEGVIKRGVGYAKADNWQRLSGECSFIVRGILAQIEEKDLLNERLSPFIQEVALELEHVYQLLLQGVLYDGEELKCPTEGSYVDLHTKALLWKSVSMTRLSEGVFAYFTEGWTYILTELGADEDGEREFKLIVICPNSVSESKRFQRRDTALDFVASHSSKLGDLQQSDSGDA